MIKTELFHSPYILIALTLFLSACAQNNSTVDVSQKTLTPALPTATIEPSATITPLPTSTSQPTPTITLTLPATLEPVHAKEAIQKLLQEPIDCAAPCFWGIVPGRTTLGEATNIFTYLGLQLKYVNTLRGSEFYENQYDFSDGLSVSSNYQIQDGIVKSTRVYISPEKQKEGISREWLAYSPETLINRYGSPSKVDLFLGRGSLTSFMMDVYFDDVDLVVRYYIFDLRTKIQVCPLTDQFEAVQMWLGKNSSLSTPDAVPLENGTSLTMGKFSELMTGDPNKACFNIKAEVFP